MKKTLVYCDRCEKNDAQYMPHLMGGWGLIILMLILGVGCGGLNDESAPKMV